MQPGQKRPSPTTILDQDEDHGQVHQYKKPKREEEESQVEDQAQAYPIFLDRSQQCLSENI